MSPKDCKWRLGVWKPTKNAFSQLLPAEKISADWQEAVRTWPLKRYLQTMLSTRTVIFDKARSSNDPIQPPSTSPASATTS